jgi:hypothetical protein
MTSNLVIGHCGFWDQAINWVEYSYGSKDYASYNSLIPSLNRGAYCARGSAGTAFSVYVDMGSIAARTFDYVILVNGKYYLNNYISSWYWAGSTTAPGATTTICQTGTFSSNAVFVGPTLSDAIMSAEHGGIGGGSLPASPSYRYYQFEHYTSSSVVINQFAFLPGQYFDLGKDPDAVSFKRVPPTDSNFIPAGGTILLNRSRRPLYEFEITWNGITDTNLKSFYSTIAAKRLRYPSMYLITRTDHTVLDGCKAINVELIDFSSEPLRREGNYNTLTASFREIGD